MPSVSTILDEARKLPAEQQRALVEELSAGLNGGARLESRLPGVEPRPIPGQIFGYWLGADDALPSVRPAWPPTGALLPAQGSTIADCPLCLDLVPFSEGWLPLSESGILTYEHSSELTYGEPYRFVCAEEAWREQVFRVEFADLVDCDIVSERYGHEAGRRAGDDRLIVQLKLERLR